MFIVIMPRYMIYCCIKNCRNSGLMYANYNPSENVRFYFFPKKSLFYPWRNEKRQLWINAVRPYIKNANKDSWEPGKSVRICSEHFIDNAKAEHPNDPAYVPSIFPDKINDIVYYYPLKSADIFTKDEIMKAKLQDSDDKFIHVNCGAVPCLNLKKEIEVHNDTDKVEEMVTVKKEKEVEDNNDNVQDVEEEMMVVKEEELNIDDTIILQAETIRSIGCQTTINPEDITVKLNYFTCTLRSYDGINDAETQVNLITNISDNSKSVSSECIGFHGFNTVKSDEELRNLCGVSFKTFYTLLKFIPDQLRDSRGEQVLSSTNKLMLFLMKLKTGLSDISLSTLFAIHRNTVPVIFLSILKHLAIMIPDYVAWPSRDKVRDNRPDVLKREYPNCRVILDRAEFNIDASRILANVEYNNPNTIKVLIGYTPDGFVCFKSKLYEKQISDHFIIKDCGLLNLLNPHDVVLSNKDYFHIKVEVENTDAIFIVPSFDSTASERIHVEACIQRINTFRILQSIPPEHSQFADEIITTICSLINSELPLSNH